MRDGLFFIVCPACNKKSKSKDLLPSKLKPKWMELIKIRKVCPLCKAEMIMEIGSVKRLNFILFFMLFAAVICVGLIYFGEQISFVCTDNIPYVLVIIVFFCVGYFHLTFYTAKYELNTIDKV